jgi:hypothetical protein
MSIDSQAGARRLRTARPSLPAEPRIRALAAAVAAAPPHPAFFWFAPSGLWFSYSAGRGR